jgi:hypothetical protein
MNFQQIYEQAKLKEGLIEDAEIEKARRMSYGRDYAYPEELANEISLVIDDALEDSPFSNLDKRVFLENLISEIKDKITELDGE